MKGVAVAAGNALGADAGADVARAGGNAVDACIAAAIMAWVAEPLVGSPAGGGFVAIGTPSGTTEVVDGNVAMPVTAPPDPGRGIRRVFLPEYANGIFVGIGGGSVAVPGIVAALRRAWERHGRIQWPALFAPAIRAARAGIAFPRTSAYFASATWRELWSAYPETVSCFGANSGEQLREGETLVQPELAEVLAELAEAGPGALYGGPLGDDLVAAAAADGGWIGAHDLAAYEAEVRAPVAAGAWGWEVASNPPPAVGGAVVVHMIELLRSADMSSPQRRLAAIVAAQRTALTHRIKRYGDPGAVASAFDEVLRGLRPPDAIRALRSESTTHCSAAGSDGLACAITQSIGYGAGPSTRGVLLNNALGEEELNPRGWHRLEPGSRCLSNMAPTIARGRGRTVALGSPGSDRIVTAVLQTLIALAVDGCNLGDAVAAARAHLEVRGDDFRLCIEPGLPSPGDAMDVLAYPQRHMFFGAVQAAETDGAGRVDAAHDPRRSGAHVVV